MTSQTAPITRVEVLRAIAHPARVRLYELLVHDGRATVSQLATKAQLAIGSTSYHLRQLHQAGFVREVQESHDRREHWWEAVPGGLQWSPADFLDSPGARQASSAAQRLLTERRVQRLGHWQNTWDQWEPEWLQAAVETDTMLRLTPAELAEFGAELQDVIRRWRERAGTGAAGSRDERRTVFAFISAFPVTEAALEVGQRPDTTQVMTQ